MLAETDCSHVIMTALVFKLVLNQASSVYFTAGYMALTSGSYSRLRLCRVYRTKRMIRTRRARQEPATMNGAED